MASDRRRPDGPFDLSIRRVIDAPRALIWKAWTDPEHVKNWWAPKPWSTVACEIDLCPGGMFRTVMRSPEGRIIRMSGACSSSSRTRSWS